MRPDQITSTPEQPEAGLSPATGFELASGALLGWMDRDEAIRILIEDGLFSPPLTRRAVPTSEADLKATRKFRSWYPRYPPA